MAIPLLYSGSSNTGSWISNNKMMIMMMIMTTTTTVDHCDFYDFYDHCRNVIKSDINNERPTYTDKIRQQSSTDNSFSLTVNDFSDFWRPLWKTEKKVNLEAKYIHTVAEAMQSIMTTPVDELIGIEEKERIGTGARLVTTK